ASQGGRIESTPAAEVASVTGPVMPETANPGGSSAAVATAPPPATATAGTPSFASQFTFDTLLARCAQGEWNPDPKTMLFFNREENARGAEQSRTLRSRLYQMREKVSLKKILVTSALPKEGKSFVSANLAQVLVKQHGRR